MLDSCPVIKPSKHTTLFWRPSDVHNVQKTLKRRPNNALCYERGKLGKDSKQNHMDDETKGRSSS